MMRFSTLIKNPADWMRGSGPHSDVVMTSRVRLARNLRNTPFPGYSQEKQRVALLNEVRPVLEALPEMKDGFSDDYTHLSKIRKQVLVERHLISREHAARSTGCGVVVDRKQSVSIMINEEDHFRIQGIRPGLNLRSAFDLVDAVDTELEAQLPYAFDLKLGYLTACPTNLGTGMRASVMLWLLERRTGCTTRLEAAPSDGYTRPASSPRSVAVGQADQDRRMDFGRREDVHQAVAGRW